MPTRLFKPLHKDILSTGLYSLDLRLGGSIPRGCMIEVFGPATSGKTSLSGSIIYQTQQVGGTALLLDVDNSFTSEPVMKDIGIDTKSLIYNVPDNAESAFALITKAIRNEVDTVILDDIGYLATKDELAGDIEFNLTQVVNNRIQALASALVGTRTSVIVMNQVRIPIPQSYPGHQTSPGGLLLRTFAHRRIQLSVGGPIQDSYGRVLGGNVFARVHKKIGYPSFKRVAISIYKHGFDYADDMIDLCIDTGIINKTGGWLELNGSKYQNSEELKLWLLQNPQDLETIDSKIQKLMNIE